MKENILNLWKKIKENKEIVLATISIFIVICVMFTGYYFINENGKADSSNIAMTDEEPKNYVYLSDLDYLTYNNWSYSGWKSIEKDRNSEGKTITARIDGVVKPFIKGMGFHAKGQLTYDISELSSKYSRFVAKVGVDGSRTDRSNIWFQFFYSDDGETWVSLQKTGAIKFDSNALNIDLPIAGHKYFRIYVDSNGKNDNDHAVLADAKFITDDFEEVSYEEFTSIHPLEYYDNIFNGADIENNINDNHRLIVEREIVRKLGYQILQSFYNLNEDARDILNWMFNSDVSDRVLEEIIEVGDITNASEFLIVMNNIYKSCKNDLATENGYVYEKVMIAMAAAYSSSDPLWTPFNFYGQAKRYNPVTRFALIKDLYDNNRFKRLTTNALKGTWTENEWFKDYSMPLMRVVVHDGASDIDLNWLNGYTHEGVAFHFWAINYVTPNYNKAVCYDEVNREKYTTKYHLDTYNVPYGVNSGQRYWMVLENGGICWNQSRFGETMYRSNGIPALGGYQYGHNSFFSYYQDEDGKGFWTGRYGNFAAGTKWFGSVRYRHLLDWANKPFTHQNVANSWSGYNSAGYLYLAQENLNHYDDYKNSIYYNALANSFTDKYKKLEIYFKSLEANKLNLDTYEAIINLYKALSVKNGGTITENDWYDFAAKMIDAYTFYPVAMTDLLQIINPYLGARRLEIDLLKRDALTRATKATKADTNSPDGTKQNANGLIGGAKVIPVTFSFDGDNAGKIVRNANYQIAWGYSLDGGLTYTNQIDVDSITLTKEELESITAENDIKVSFMGLPEYGYTVDITKATIANNTLYANDLENRVAGVNLTYEWRNSEEDDWTSYAVASPNNTGNKTLYVRIGATGQKLPSDSKEFTFTEDNLPDTRKYLPVSYLGIHSVSTQSANKGNYVTNAIDGNIYTRWVTDWSGNDTNRHIAFKLDYPLYIKAIEYVPTQPTVTGTSGTIKDANVYASEDGEVWTLVKEIRDWEANRDNKTIEFDEPIYAQYFKFEMLSNYNAQLNNTNNYASAVMFNFYYDSTKKEIPLVSIAYSTMNPTNGNVIARIINQAENFEILNNDKKDEYIFTNKGEFTFKYRIGGMLGSILAKVDWIDKEAPTAEIKYNTENKTNGSVIATLVPSEEVIVTNNGEYRLDDDGNILNRYGEILEGYTVDKNGEVKDENGNRIANMNTFTYEFFENGEFTFEFKDLAGNKGTKTASVSWIDQTIPEATLNYDITGITNKNVTVNLEFNKAVIKVTNNNGKTSYTFRENGSFTFEFKDLAGNKGTITAKVDWIDKEAPTAELKYEKYDDKVIVKVINPSKEITFQDGIGVYVFTKNGNYDIVFSDKAGNTTKLTAVIDSLKDSDNSNNNDNQNNDNNQNNSNNNQSNNNSSNNNNNNSNNNSQNTPINKNYKKFTLNSISIDMPVDVIDDNVIFKVESFKLPNELKNKFVDSDLYDLYFENKEFEKLNINSKNPIKISIMLNVTKELAGVYEITDDNQAKKVEYIRNGNNIEITSSTLGRYIVSYKEVNETNNNDKNDDIKPTKTEEKKKGNILVWIIGSASVILVGLGIYFYKPKNKNI